MRHAAIDQEARALHHAVSMPGVHILPGAPTTAEPAAGDQHFHALLDALPDAVYTADVTGRITFYNTAELWGHHPEFGKSEWCGSWRLFCPDGRAMRHDECPMAVALREVRSLTGEAIAVQPDGTEIPSAAYPKPLRDPTGELIGAVNTLIDISHRKAHGRQQRLLINALNHRVNHRLATVRSIARQSLRGCPEEQLSYFQDRLIALSEAHDVLNGQNWDGAGIHELLAKVFAPLGDAGRRRFELTGPALFLSPRMALSLAMALHELCANAAKYGALSVPEARVLVTWSLRGQYSDTKLHLHWEEQGGPPVQAPMQTGFGSRLITRGVAHELGASVRLDFPVTGVICDIDAPIGLMTHEPG